MFRKVWTLLLIPFNGSINGSLLVSGLISSPIDFCGKVGFSDALTDRG